MGLPHIKRTKPLKYNCVGSVKYFFPVFSSKDDAYFSYPIIIEILYNFNKYDMRVFMDMIIMVLLYDPILSKAKVIAFLNKINTTAYLMPFPLHAWIRYSISVFNLA